MRMLSVVVTLTIVSTLAAAQAPSSKVAPRPTSRPTGTLAQIMRGIYFSNSNLIFDVQQNDPTAPKKKNTEPGASPVHGEF